ncbi:hypothetical protein [Natronoglycomyces albus]|uniref:Uncharacterized protein n=1 Tax=Natronoglycomyces albus TaxID=2811108 RepID=A0A895XP54_9ACTN|nr:hypothetical protein [Natronoglycomyces albus]QSB04855.1 hypothetical protein JQS30_13965 [Natronoglycomyces albus]
MAVPTNNRRGSEVDVTAVSQICDALAAEAGDVAQQRERVGQFLLREPSEADFGTPQATTAEQAIVRAHGTLAQDTVQLLAEVEVGFRRVGAIMEHSLRSLGELDEQQAQAIKRATEVIAEQGGSNEYLTNLRGHHGR